MRPVENARKLDKKDYQHIQSASRSWGSFSNRSSPRDDNERPRSRVPLGCGKNRLQKRAAEEFQTMELLAIYGPEYRMVYLRYDIANCPAENGF